MAKGKDKPKKEVKKPKGKPKPKSARFATDNSNSEGPIINHGVNRDPRRAGRTVITG